MIFLGPEQFFKGFTFIQKVMILHKTVIVCYSFLRHKKSRFPYWRIDFEVSYITNTTLV
jgi:hypothetical protein